MEKDTIISFGHEDGDEQLVQPSYFRDIAPNRKQMVETYLSSLNGFEQDSVSYLAKNFQVEGRPLADTVALIPVAAHQEENAISGAMEQYARQQARRPFSVLLYPNAPDESDASAVEATMKQIALAQRRHPDLDLRATPPEVYLEPKIGTIRRDLWSAALLLAHYEGNFEDPAHDVIGLNHDIDLVRMSPRYIDRVQTRMDETQQRYMSLNLPASVMRPYSTFVKHAHDPLRPNAARATFWYDFSYWQQRPRGSYDAGLVLPFSYYAKQGGITPEASYHEMAPMLHGGIYVIPRTVLETSPRRFAERLQSHGFDEVWTEDSFGADEKYRVDDNMPDISKEQLESVVLNSLDDSIDYFFSGVMHVYRMRSLVERTKSADSLEARLARKKHLAVTVLDRVVDLPHVARMVERNYDTQAIASKVVRFE